MKTEIIKKLKILGINQSAQLIDREIDDWRLLKFIEIKEKYSGNNTKIEKEQIKINQIHSELSKYNNDQLINFLIEKEKKEKELKEKKERELKEKKERELKEKKERALKEKKERELKEKKERELAIFFIRTVFIVFFGGLVFVIPNWNKIFLGNNSQKNINQNSYPEKKVFKPKIQNKKIYKTEIYSDGKYEGEFLNGERNGQGKFTWNNGSKYIGGWLNGKQHGQGTETQTNGETFEGEWLNGKLHGQATYTWDNGNSKYIGGWFNGEQHGQGIYVRWENGMKYIFETYNGDVTKKGKIIYQDGREVKISW